MSFNINDMVEYIYDRTGFKGGVAIVLGSGLGDFADHLTEKTVVPYNDIPDYPQPTVEGHAGEFVFGKLMGRSVLAAKGRFHFYEGHGFETVTLPVALFSKLGVDALIITNAAGSTRKDHPPGTLMVLTGHSDCTFRLDRGDPVIVAGEPYHDQKLIDLASQAGIDEDIELKQGTYCWTLGPAYETPAEINYIKSFGGDAVGMSTVPELQAAARFDLPALGISCLTNYAAGITNQPLTHDEVIETAEAVKDQFTRLVLEIITKIGSELEKAVV